MMITPLKGPLVLVILDGWGHRHELKDNGIAQAKKPFFDSLIRDYPHTLIDGSGPAVGLPKGVMGNSEVGHMNLGAGRIVYSGLSQIYHAIEDGSFFNNTVLLKAFQQARTAGSTLHLMGLVSDGAVHSHQDHLYALLRLARDTGVTDIVVHCFMDGRDTHPQSGVKYLRQLQDEMKKIGVGEIASVAGRYYAMDRDKRWDRVARAFYTVCGTGPVRISDPVSYLEKSYAENIGDEFIIPASVVNGDGQVTTMNADDAVIFLNFRADRAREISHAFVDVDFAGFVRGPQVLPKVFVGMTPYENNLAAPAAFLPTYPEKILPEILAANGIKQLRIAETEKFAHVTFFFNGGRELIYDGEERALIPSPKDVATYDLKPEMSASQVKDELLKRLDVGKYGVVVCNFANADMVGHTAVPRAIIKAVETIDSCLSEIVTKILLLDGAVIITADHGNAEEMKDTNGQPLTAHTTNLVPFILVQKGMTGKFALRSGGRLCDVAPTMLKLLGIPKPIEMTGESLLS